MIMSQVAWSQFPGREGEAFTLHTGEGVPVEVILVRVDGPVAQPDGGGSVSVVFHGPANQPVAQGAYDVDHGELGRFPLFVVPVGINGESLVYQAVFTWLAIP